MRLGGWFATLIGVIRKLFGRREGDKSPPSVEEAEAAIASVEHWYHRIEVAPGVITPGSHDSPAALRFVGMPDDLEGKRVLDVGARDGFFSFEAEKRGAKVVAVDQVAPNLTGFAVASGLLGSRVRYVTANVYDLKPEKMGRFDAILFLGVLYHLRDPMLALDRLAEIANPGATIWVESHIIDSGFVDPETGEFQELTSLNPKLADVPLAQFYPHSLLGSSSTNKWGPNLACLRAMVEEAGFRVERSEAVGSRGLVVGTRVTEERADFFRQRDRRVTTSREQLEKEYCLDHETPDDSPASGAK